MSLKGRAKTLAGVRLSYRSRLFARRLFVNTVGGAVRLAARLYDTGARVIDLATTHGLDLQRAWDVRPRTTKRTAPPAPPFGARDFLSLMDALGLRPAAAGDSAQQTLTAEQQTLTPEQQTLAVGVPTTLAPVERTIRASIIIRVSDGVESTFQTLRPLLAEIDSGENEIIVVDDASTDETARLLSHFGAGLRVVRNEISLGYVGSRNRGAAVARGAHLVFLNNDTTVSPGWLGALVETAEADAEVGAVGSMLLSPDGRVREAGGIVSRDGASLRHGRGQSPDDRRLNFAREVDYCSGASLLVRRELFERLGGFDARYAPACYEDADLCFGVRSLGFKVVYQPLSRLTHFAGVTPATDVGAGGVEQRQTINREKFVAKWRETLERDHHGRVEAGDAADRRRGPRVLVVNDRLPSPDRDAGSLRMLLALSILARWARPAFVNLSKHRREEYERNLWRVGVESIGPADFLRLARRGEFRVAILSRPDVAEALIPALRAADPRLKLIFDMVDAHFIRMEREVAVTDDPNLAAEAARYRELELRLARACDLIWCASAEDERGIRGGAASVPVELIPTIHELRDAGRSFDERAGLLYIGNFSHRPNEDGLHFFMREIFPRVREELPGVTLGIAGDRATDEIRAYESEGVRVLGYVPDLEPLIAASRVFVAPLRFGAGIKGKIGESLAHGLPLVTTSIGAEGMGLTDGEHALIEDDALDFAASVARLYRERELWQRLADAGRRHVEQHFTPGAVGRTINRSIRRLTGDALE